MDEYPEYSPAAQNYREVEDYLARAMFADDGAESESAA
jgi:hypothetical protein